MKTVLGILTIGLAGVLVSAAAQPAAEDFASFSQFIGQRNIFNPARPLFTAAQPGGIQIPAQAGVTPQVQFVGTMSYAKGMFAFFSGNSEQLCQVLRVGDQVADRTITEITARGARLESAGGQRELNLKIGEGFQQEDSRWVFAGANDLAARTAPGSAESDSSSLTSAQPPSATEQNETLKRLKQLREKENQ